MELNASQVNIVRDVAIFFEKKDIQISCDLMNAALINRPNGSTIKRKADEYNKKSTPSKDIGNSLKKACIALSDNPELLIKILPIARYSIPSDKDLIRLEHENTLILDLTKKVSQLEAQIELFRNKFNQLHKAICYSNVLKVRKIDDYAAKVSPIEFINKNAPKTLIVFGGMALRPSMPPKEFFRSLNNRDINLIFLKDFQQCWYQNGLMGITEDIQSTVLYIKNLIPKTSKELICIGTSAGAFAAIRIGVALEANRILAFGPQTYIEKSVFNKFKSLDSRISEINISKNDLDLRKFLSKKGAILKSEIEIYYGEQNNIDKQAALRIKDFVKLYSYPTKSHLIASYLKNEKKLEGILNSI